MGAEAIKELLEAIDLEKEYEELQAGLENASGQKRARIVKRLELWKHSVNPATNRSG